MEIHHHSESIKIDVLPLTQSEENTAISDGFQSFVQLNETRLPGKIKNELISQAEAECDAGLNPGTHPEKPIFSIIVDNSGAYLSAFLPTTESSSYLEVILSDLELDAINKLIA